MSCIIAIAGGSGSGKTTVVNLIQDACPEINIIVMQQDHYYRDLSHLSMNQRAQSNFDHPDSIDFELFAGHLKALSNGEEIERPTYCFKTHTRTKDYVSMKPGPVVIVDGIFVLQNPQIRQLASLKLFVEVPDDIRFIRRLKRDIHERGREMNGVIHQYLDTVRPMHNQFIEQSKSYADFIVHWQEKNMDAIEMIASMLKHKSRLVTESTNFKQTLSQTPVLGHQSNPHYSQSQ